MNHIREYLKPETEIQDCQPGPCSKVEKLGVQLEVGPSIKNRIDEYHTELADVRFRILCQFLLEAFKHGHESNSLVLPGLLKDAAGLHANCHEFLQFVVGHGVPRGLGEALEEAVACVSDDSEPYKKMMSLIEHAVFYRGRAVAETLQSTVAA